MASLSLRQLINPQTSPKLQFFSAQLISMSPAFTTLTGNHNQSSNLSLLFSGHRNLTVPVKSSSGKDDAVSVGDEEGVSLGTMKLPLDTDIPRFETLLFQWANSLCQGAQLPLPVPLKNGMEYVASYYLSNGKESIPKVDKIEGGVRLGFVTIDDGKTDVAVYIDCLVIQGNNESSPPIFRATRNGARKDKVPPGEPRIMKSLLAALRKSAEIARV